jgi:hypothetical protein
MRALKSAALVMVLLVNALALLWMLSVRVVPAEGGRGAGDTAAGNGDVNCDGRIDLSDPVYMLSYLFQDGPELCAIAQEPELLSRIEVLEREVEELKNPCEARDDRFVDNGDGTITDQCTGLMWSKEPLDNVNDAEARIAALDSTLGGFDNWRIPTRDEFAEIVRPQPGNWEPGSALPISSGPRGSLWSATEEECAQAPRCRWVFFFNRGRLNVLPTGNDGLSAIFVRDPE